MADRVGLLAAGRPLVPSLRSGPTAGLRSSPTLSPRTVVQVRSLPWRVPAAAVSEGMAERVGFEPTCRFYPTIRFRVGAVMTASVPLRRSRRDQGAAILAESLCGEGRFMRALVLAALLVALGAASSCSKLAPAGALDAIHARGELRVATLNLPTCYYLGAQGTEGLEFELAGAYAARLGVRLTMYPLANERALQAELAAGRADIAAASLTNTPEWSRAGDAAEPYASIPQLVLYPRNAVRPRDTLQLESAHLAVRAGSAQERILERLRSTMAPQLQWEETAPSSADPVEDVDSGEAQYAIVDAREFSFARHLYPDVQVGFALPEERPVQWIVRRDAPGLLGSINAFFSDLRATG